MPCTDGDGTCDWGGDADNVRTSAGVASVDTIANGSVTRPISYGVVVNSGSRVGSIWAFIKMGMGRSDMGKCIGEVKLLTASSGGGGLARKARFGSWGGKSMGKPVVGCTASSGWVEDMKGACKMSSVSGGRMGVVSISPRLVASVVSWS